MKLSIRTLDQKTFNVEIGEAQKVVELKQVLVDMAGTALSVEKLQLIYAGRIMEDDLLLSDYNIEDGKFIVMMGKKNVVEVKQTKEEEPVPPTPPISVVPSEQSPAFATSAPALTPPSMAADEQRVRDLISMGYGETEVRAALRASFNHPERAIEYLINGIPAQAVITDLHQPRAAGSEIAENLVPLVTDPRFQQVRDMIRTNPELLEVVLARLRESDPATFETIRTHQREFLALLNSDSADADASEPNETAHNYLQVTLTEEEAAAVERLTSLGFQREMAVQVYLACDKNEELAADILFRQSEEDDQ